MNSITRFYVPGDAASRALGADAVATRLQALLSASDTNIDIVRNGTRGLIWLEPLLEVEFNGRRLAYGPVAENELEGILADCLNSEALGQHRLYLGETENIELLRRQQRVSFARVGVIDPLSLVDYQQHGGLAALQRALDMSPQALVDCVKDSGLRGRGGAAFPAGIKWQTVLDASSSAGFDAIKKYIVCNADEGDSGTFADRILMEGDPFSLIEGMIIAGLAVGSEYGYIYLRSEYPHAKRCLQQALQIARDAGLLGDDICGRGRRFDIELRLGAGAYICGEETALLDSLEGKRGMVRAKPPLPAIEGLFGQPTVVNNVLTLAAVPDIVRLGADHYQGFGVGRSRGTLAVQLAGNIKRGGLYEVAFGLPLRQVVEEFGGGTASGRAVRAIQVGGPLGAYLPESLWDTPLDYEAFADVGAMLGHGGIVVFDDSVNMAEQAEYAMQFCALESCGKCTPCRIGAVRGVETLQKIRRGDDTAQNLRLLDDLCNTMRDGSLCAMGGLTPDPVRSAFQYFKEDFHA